MNTGIIIDEADTVYFLKFITRAEARARIVAHWLKTRTPEELLATREPDWPRMRNYEFEEMLGRTSEGEWIISEWCPFNGRFCQLRDHVPPPHPPMGDEKPPFRDSVGIPWRIYGGELVSKYEVTL